MRKYQTQLHKQIVLRSPANLVMISQKHGGRLLKKTLAETYDDLSIFYTMIHALSYLVKKKTKSNSTLKLSNIILG